MSLQRLDWDTLRVFSAVAELASMNAAAARLGESTPTISRKIDELERVLGATLFNRSTRGVELTDTGRAILKFALKMSEAADHVQLEAAARSSQAEGSVTVITGDGLGPYWIAPRLSEFHAAHPNVRVRLFVEEIPPELLDTDDAVISIQSSLPAGGDIIAHRLGVQHYMAFASPAYLVEHKAPESLFEFYKHRCILHRAYVNQVERWAPKVAALRKMIDFAIITNSGTVAIEACARGAGIAILPSYITEVDRRLVPLDAPEIAPIQFWVAYTERVRRQPTGKVMIDWLKRVFDAPDVPWFRADFVHPREMEGQAMLLKG